MIELILTSFSTPGASKETDEYVASIKSKLIMIRAKYEEYHLYQLNSDIDMCFESIKTIELYSENKGDSIYQANYDILLNQFDKIEYADFLMESIEIEKDNLSTEYFALWNKIFSMKIRVDKLYSKTNIAQNIALDVNEEIISYRKRQIYFACSALYSNFVKDLKRAIECDYITKIKVLRKMDTLLDVSEKLLYADNIRTLEKSLKKLTKPNQIIEVMSEHEIAKSITL